MRWTKGNLAKISADRSQYDSFYNKEYAKLGEKGEMDELHKGWLAHKYASRKVIKDFASSYGIEVEKIYFKERGFKPSTLISFDSKGKDLDIDALTKELLDAVPQIEAISFWHIGAEDEIVQKRDLYHPTASPHD